MNMPDGWKRLDLLCTQLKQSQKVSSEGYDIVKCHELLKEFAETMDTINVSCDHGLIQNPGVKLLVSNSIKQLKDWK